MAASCSTQGFSAIKLSWQLGAWCREASRAACEGRRATRDGLTKGKAWAGKGRPAASKSTPTPFFPPGMTGTVEIDTGKRKLIEHVLSPLIRVGSKSLRER
jgi:hypothetical protein